MMIIMFVLVSVHCTVEFKSAIFYVALCGILWVQNVKRKRQTVVDLASILCFVF